MTQKILNEVNLYIFEEILGILKDKYAIKIKW